MKELDKILSDIAARIDASDNDANRERLKEHYRTLLDPLINQEVEKRIKERMPSLDDLDARLTEYLVGILDSVDFHEWLCSRLTCSEKPNNSQKTEGGEG